jgi:ubiquinol-cytochrome c reductase cytochrome c subunit
VRALLGVPAAVAAIAGLVSFASPGSGAAPEQTLAEVGAELYAGQCASCHGTDGTGIPNRGPTLLDEGPAAVDFVLRTGRMPLANPHKQATREPTRYSDAEIRALVAYAGAFGNGPAIPNVDIAAGNLANGAHLFQLNCAACHVASGAGAAIGGGRNAPDLMDSTATEVGEAILVGPGAMPVFGSFSDQDINDVAAYVKDLQRMRTTAPDDFGGAGPVAEGLAAWLLALLPLIALTRWIGTPHEGRDAPTATSEPAEGLPS